MTMTKKTHLRFLTFRKNAQTVNKSKSYLDAMYKQAHNTASGGGQNTRKYEVKK